MGQEELQYAEFWEKPWTPAEMIDRVATVLAQR
jgi:hypothetical protein